MVIRHLELYHLVSKTLNPSSVNVSTDGTTATTFTFDSPVYLEENKEYCFVVMQM